MPPSEAIQQQQKLFEAVKAELDRFTENVGAAQKDLESALQQADERWKQLETLVKPLSTDNDKRKILKRPLDIRGSNPDDRPAHLNPRMTVFDLVSEVLKVNQLAKLSEMKERVEHLLERVGMLPEYLRRVHVSAWKAILLTRPTRQRAATSIHAAAMPRSVAKPTSLSCAI